MPPVDFRFATDSKPNPCQLSDSKDTVSMPIFGGLILQTPSVTQLTDALLRHNYFPAMGKRQDELPPSVNSRGLTRRVANEILSACTVDRGVRRDFDAVNYESTRFNLVTRRLSIPHPLPYVRLVNCIATNWKDLKYLTKNKASQFRPTVHGDGRIFAMNYGEQSYQNRIYNRWLRFGSEYRVSADVANFYPSFYTHSMPWAIAGHQTAKSNRSPTIWYNKLDHAFSDCNRGETHGLHVGPGTSALAAEIVLHAIDNSLGGKYKYIRFIDDYKFYAGDRREAEQFILELAEQLAAFGLMLNNNKTTIEMLPLPGNPDWMRTLIPQVPKSTQFSQLEPYLEEATELAKRTPEGNVLKFAVAAVRDAKEIDTRADEILPCLFAISFHNPELLPDVSLIFETSNADGASYTDELNTLLQRHARFGRSDGMSWILHIMRKEGVKICDESVDSVIRTKDCIPILLLHKLGQSSSTTAVKTYAQNELKANTYEYDIDKYWLLYYELFREGVISNPYPNMKRQSSARMSFEILKKNGISFTQ